MGIRQRTSKSQARVSPVNTIELQASHFSVDDEKGMEASKSRILSPTVSIAKLFFISNVCCNQTSSRSFSSWKTLRNSLAALTVLLLLMLSTVNLVILGRQSSEASSSSLSAAILWKNENLKDKPRRTRATLPKPANTWHPRVYELKPSFFEQQLLVFPSTRERIPYLPELVLSRNNSEDESENMAQSTQPPVPISDSDQDCVPMANWQQASYPTCNNMHDIDMRAYILSQWSKPNIPQITTQAETSPSNTNETEGTEEEPVTSSLTHELRILANGWFRTTWEWHTGWDDVEGENSNIVVLKTLRLEREFLFEYYNLHNRDAVAMERLTFSPHVVNIYGYCGQSAINEYADFPHGDDIKSLEKLSRRMRGKYEPRSMLLRLFVASSVATGLAHVHRAGSQWRTDLPAQVMPQDQAYPALIVHYDINPRNIALFNGGRPKINDFNIAEFIRYNPSRKQACGFKSRMHSPWWRSPEEVRSNNATSDPVLLNEKVDIYALGSTLFHLFTSFSPRGKMILEREEMVTKQVIAGEAPQLLPEFQNATDIVSQAFRLVIEKCHQKEPQHRWSAQQIANYFMKILREHKAELLRATEQEQNTDTASSIVTTTQSDSKVMEEEEEQEEAVLQNKG